MPARARPLDAAFYLQDTTTVARRLIGAMLVRRTPNGILAGRIVETEAYLSKDPANHAFRGKTTRNRTMFGPPGRAYIYAIHRCHCLNVVTRPEGVAEAVLVRSVEPLEGTETMKRNRGTEDLRLLASGPGRLCQAFSIDRALDGVPLYEGDLVILPGAPCRRIERTARVGVSAGKQLPLRFFARGSPFVSSPRSQR